MKKIYLDYAAATPIDKEVLQAMQPYFTDKFYNPSATYLAGRAARHDLNNFRSRAAQVIGSRPAEIIFTSGATEANNLALKGVAASFPEGKVLVSAIEHDSVLNPARALGAEVVPVNQQGMVDVSRLELLIDDKTVLVSVMLVNNELGIIQPLREVAQLIAEQSEQRLKRGNKLPIYLHTDAAQAGNYLDLHVSRLGVDMMSVNGGKIYGPKGAGLLYVKSGVRLSAVNSGGGQEFGMRSGTENLPSIAGLVKAFERAQAARDSENRRLQALRQDFEKQLAAIAEDVQINGGKHRAPHLVSITFAGQDNETLMIKLDEVGIECATGSACSASSDLPSHVLKAIGLSDELARSTLRFSFGKFTRAADLEKTVDALRTILGA